VVQRTLTLFDGSVIVVAASATSTPTQPTSQPTAEEQFEFQLLPANAIPLHVDVPMNSAPVQIESAEHRADNHLFVVSPAGDLIIVNLGNRTQTPTGNVLML
jgi:hypothetical protein